MDVQKSTQFDEKMDRLKAVVKQLEGELPLDRALELYAEGVSLCKELNIELTEAEKRIVK